MAASNDFLGILATYQLYALERQLALPALFQGSWSFDMQSGTVTFTNGEDSRAVAVQILGTESHGSGTFLWAWANGASGIPAPLLQASLALKDFGEQQSVPELASPSHALEDVDGHMIAMATLGLLPSDAAPAYYRCPYDGGAMFVLLAEAGVHPPPDRPLLRLTTVLPQVAADLVHLPAALHGYAQRHDLTLNELDGGFELVGAGGTATVGIDEQGRLQGIKASLS